MTFGNRSNFCPLDVSCYDNIFSFRDKEVSVVFIDSSTETSFRTFIQDSCSAEGDIRKLNRILPNWCVCKLGMSHPYKHQVSCRWIQDSFINFVIVKEGIIRFSSVHVELHQFILLEGIVNEEGTDGECLSMIPLNQRTQGRS